MSRGECDKRQVPVAGKALMDAMDSLPQKQSIMQMLARLVASSPPLTKMRPETSFEGFYSRVDELFPPREAGVELAGLLLPDSDPRSPNGPSILRPLTSLSVLPFFSFLLKERMKENCPRHRTFVSRKRESVL